MTGSEKLTNGGRGAAKSYSEEMYRKAVLEHIGPEWTGLDDEKSKALRKRAEEELLDKAGWDYPGSHEETAREALRNFECDGFQFSETWEWDLRDFDHHFLLACYAIRWGIAQYDEARVKPLAGASA